MSKPALEFANVSKSFTVWHEKPPREIKTHLVRLMKRKWTKTGRSTFSVLENVSFQIQPGEFVGIMGRNGAGKSTIMKLLSGIYTPDTGEVRARGMLAPLLELGAGFSDELSGYENIFLNAAILGYGREATLRRLDSIIEFSELGEKIELPIKNYSSGMLVRLGFSVAAHLDSEIILLDEVMGVGDAGFVEKSTKKIRDLHREGRTMLLVTHSPTVVVNHCSRCIVIDQQKKVFDGDPKAAGDLYMRLVTGHGVPAAP